MHFNAIYIILYIFQDYHNKLLKKSKLCPLRCPFFKKYKHLFVFLFTIGRKCGIIEERSERLLCAHPYRKDFRAQRGKLKRKRVIPLGDYISEKEESGSPSQGERIVKIEEREKINSHRIDKLEALANAINSQNENITRLVIQLEEANRRLENQDERLCDIEKQPLIRFTSVIKAVISAVAGAVAGALISLLL